MKKFSLRQIINGLGFGVAAAACFLIFKPAVAATYIPAAISGDVTWAKQDSPIVIGDWFGYPEGRESQ